MSKRRKILLGLAGLVAVGATVIWQLRSIDVTDPMDTGYGSD